jgi:PIN domain nuclease of toxin-antitoxin system
MTVYVADTHTLLWYLGGSAQLSSSARAALDSAASGESQVVVPAIVNK